MSYSCLRRTTFYTWHCFAQGPRDALRWSGFLGDPLAGSHFQPNLSSWSYAEARAQFLRLNQWTKVSGLRLSHPDMELASLLPEEPPIGDPSVLSYAEQLDLTVRQTSWIRRTVVPKGARTPFLSPTWTRYMLAAPPQLRTKCRLYHRIAARVNPLLFRLPTKSARGHRILHSGGTARSYAQAVGSRVDAILGRIRGRPEPNRNLNFIDPQRAFYAHPDLRRLLKEAIVRLSDARNLPWLDVHGLYRDFTGGDGRLHDVMELLLSLETNLRGPQHDGLEEGSRA